MQARIVAVLWGAWGGTKRVGQEEQQTDNVSLNLHGTSLDTRLRHRGRGYAHVDYTGRAREKK